MNGFSGIVLDEHLQVESTQNVTTTTSLAHLEALTRADKIVVHGIATTVSGSGVTQLTVVVQTSPDGRTWVQKNPSNSELVVGTGDTPFAELSGWGAEPTPTNPSMGYVGLQVQVRGTVKDVIRVRVGVSARSRTKRLKREPLQPSPTRQFRALSETTMQEIYARLLGSAHLQGDERVDHLLRNLSGPARQEVEAFTNKILNMSPVVKHAIANMSQALTNLTRMAAPSEGDASSALVKSFGDRDEGRR